MGLSPVRFAAATAGAALATWAASAVLTARPPGGRERWIRTNHAGRTVSLLEGPAAIGGGGLGALIGGLALGADPVPALTAVAGPGAAGLVDDLVGDSTSKGLRGHLGALRDGRLTTGVVKIGVLGVSGVVAADRMRPPGVTGLGRVAGALLGGGVVAGSANLANLLDLRPGRTLKAAGIAGVLLGIRPGRTLPAAAALGVSGALIREDLAGRTMLGDGGANPIGALVGTAIVAQTGVPGRVVVLATLVGLTLASERVSFSRVIAATPGLRDLDAWGRE